MLRLAPLGVVVVILGLLFPRSPGAAQQGLPLAISQVALVDVATGQVEANMTVLIEGNQIVKVGKSATIPLPRGARVVDGRGRFLIPGLWDMHVHLSYARASALPALVANGVTTVRDVGSSLAEIDEWRGEIAAGTLRGPRIVRAGPMLNGREFNRYQLGVSNEIEATTAVRTLQKAGVDFIKVHRATSREAYFAIAAEAKRLSFPFAGHVPTTVTPAEASDAGQASLEHVETLFEGTFLAAVKGQDLGQAVAEWRNQEAPALFARFTANGTSVTPTLVTAQALLQALESNQTDRCEQYVSASAKRDTEELFKSLKAAAPRLLAERKPMVQQFGAIVSMMNRAGVNLLAGTDLASSYLYPGFSLHDELVLMVEAGLTPLEALRTATSNPAKLFHNVESGTIAVGKRADLMLLDADPLIEIRNTQRIRAVIFNGKLLDRQALDRLLVQAEQLAQRN